MVESLGSYPNWGNDDSQNTNYVYTLVLKDNCNEIVSGTNGDGYRGCQSKTKTGLTCQAWNQQAPHSHAFGGMTSKGTDGTHNYCRNPDNNPGGNWCYTTDLVTIIDYCYPLTNDCYLTNIVMETPSASTFSKSSNYYDKMKSE